MARALPERPEAGACGVALGAPVPRRTFRVAARRHLAGVPARAVHAIAAPVRAHAVFRADPAFVVDGAEQVTAAAGPADQADAAVQSVPVALGGRPEAQAAAVRRAGPVATADAARKAFNVAVGAREACVARACPGAGDSVRARPPPTADVVRVPGARGRAPAAEEVQLTGAAQGPRPVPEVTGAEAVARAAGVADPVPGADGVARGQRALHAAGHAHVPGDAETLARPQAAMAAHAVAAAGVGPPTGALLPAVQAPVARAARVARLPVPVPDRGIRLAAAL